MSKRRPLNADERWLLKTVESGGRTSYGKLCVAWAKERGTSGNVVTWPRPVVSSALEGLRGRRLLSYTPQKCRVI
jgi:hypothetical protein